MHSLLLVIALTTITITVSGQSLHTDGLYHPYNKHRPGRHVCTNQKNSTHPVRRRQAYCKPTYKKYQIPCNDNQICTGVRLVYETVYKDVIVNSNNIFSYVCCPGWTQITTRSHGCNKPVCTKSCLNGGICSKPDHCTCPEGYTGEICEQDIDECKEHKPCDHICRNTPGSFTCDCKENFALQSDGQSCRKLNDDGSSFEARDLEFETFDKRLFKLETMMDEKVKNDTWQNLQFIRKDMNILINDIRYLKDRIKDVEDYENEMDRMKNKLEKIEEKANKIDDLSVKYEKMKKCAFFNKICI